LAEDFVAQALAGRVEGCVEEGALGLQGWLVVAIKGIAVRIKALEYDVWLFGRVGSRYPYQV
jgi:hypothetical protein